MYPSVHQHPKYADGIHNYPQPAVTLGVPAYNAYNNNNNYPQMPLPLRQQQHGGNPISSKWTTGLCGCCKDCSNCCLTCWCPCITFGQIAEIADSGSTCFYRKKLRAKFNLAEKPCGDWLAHCFCESCALCQEYRELKNRGFDPALGWRGNLEKHDQAIAHSRVATAPPMGQAMNK